MNDHGRILLLYGETVPSHFYLVDGADVLFIIVTKLPPVKTADRAVIVQRLREHADAVHRMGNG